MPVTRRHSLALAAAALASPFVASSARAQSLTLRLHHFLPPASNAHRLFLAPLAQRIEQGTGGRLRVQIFPAMQLGGAPPQLFDQARDGVADIVWTLPGNTPGRFPGIEVFELPFVPARSGRTNARALQEFAATHLAAEFREVHPLCWWAHDHGVIHANRAVQKLEDLQGLKLRFPTRLAGEALRAAGAQAIGIPAPQVPESLAQRVVDGTVFPWEVVPSLRIHELVRHHTEIPGETAFYVATFVLAMNKARYEGLPADLRAVLDQETGLAAATAAGEMWDEQSARARAMVAARSQNSIVSLPAEEVEKLRQATRPVVETWLRTVRERGLHGETLLADAQAALARHRAT